MNTKKSNGSYFETLLWEINNVDEISENQKESLYNKLFNLVDKKIKRYSIQYQTRVSTVEDLENVCKMAIVESVVKFEEPEIPLKEECDIEYYVKHYFALIARNAAQCEYYKTKCAVKLDRIAYNKLRDKDGLPFSVLDDDLLIDAQDESDIPYEHKRLVEYCLKDIINTYGIKGYNEFTRYLSKPYSVYKTKTVNKIMEQLRNDKLGE